MRARCPHAHAISCGNAKSSAAASACSRSCAFVGARRLATIAATASSLISGSPRPMRLSRSLDQSKPATVALLRHPARQAVAAGPPPVDPCPLRPVVHDLPRHLKQLRQLGRGRLALRQQRKHSPAKVRIVAVRHLTTVKRGPAVSRGAPSDSPRPNHLAVLDNQRMRAPCVATYPQKATVSSRRAAPCLARARHTLP
jgi:hypothetical protein